MRLSVGGRLALVSLGVVILVAGVLAALLSVQLSDSGQREAEKVTRSVAETLAHEPDVAALVVQRATPVRCSRWSSRSSPTPTCRSSRS